MRPFDLFFNFKHGKTDGPTDISSYRDAILHLCDVPGRVAEAEAEAEALEAALFLWKRKRKRQ